MKKAVLIFIVFFNAVVLNAQGDVWTQKANLGGAARYGAVGFSIGTKGYIGTGDTTTSGTGYSTSFWEWDQATDIWTQKASFGGAARIYAVGFSIGTKGYVGTGRSAAGFLKDFWEYNPSANTWTQKANFGGTSRRYATGFSIGNKGYIGTGVDSSFTYQQDFWEYNPSTDTWTSIANFGGTARINATGFSIGGDGYLATGWDAVNKLDLWKYDTTLDVWTQKANFTGGARQGAISFSIGPRGYLGTGFSTTYKKDFFDYNPVTNTWTARANFGGTARYLAVGFSIGSKGYMGTGYDLNNAITQDFWEYAPSTAGIEENFPGVSLSVFPNPFSNSVTFLLNEELENTEVSIMDLSGKEIKKIVLKGKSVTVNNENLAPGIYFYSVTSDNKTIDSGKIVIE